MTSGDEVWRDIPGFRDLQASSQGRVRNLKTGRVILGSVGKRGYRQMSVRGERGRTTAYAHRLVAAAFHGPPAGYVTNHLNADRLDNRPTNLQLTTPAGNA